MFNEAELRLIKATFADNDDLLYAIRKVLLQFPMTEKEKEAVKTQVTPEVWAIVKKRINPDIDEDAPFGQIGDIYHTARTKLESKGVEEMQPHFDALKIVVDYLNQQFEYLKDINMPTFAAIQLDSLKEITSNHYSNYVNHTARNFLIGFVDSMLFMLKGIAGQKEETPEQQKERITRNSNK